MAKIVKVEGYLVYPNIEDSEELASLVSNYFHYTTYSSDSFWQHLSVQQADIPDWSDNHPLNYTNCSKLECESYFTGNRYRSSFNTYKKE